MSPRPLLFLALSSLAQACEGVEIAPLYERETDLCSEQNTGLFAERVAECEERFLEDGSCAGVFSFAGTLLGEPVIVDSELDESSFVDAQVAELTVVRDRVLLLGSSPYFDFVLVFYLLGGDADLGDVNRELTIGGMMQHPSGWSSDALTRADLRVTAPPDSDDLAMTGGSVLITRQTLTESAGRFMFERGEETSLSGCFHVFTQDRTINTESP